VKASSDSCPGTRSAFVKLSAGDSIELRAVSGEVVLELPFDLLARLELGKPSAHAPVPYTTLAEEANRLKVSERTLRTYLHKQNLPFHRLPGGDVRLVSTDVDQWMQGRRVGK